MSAVEERGPQSAFLQQIGAEVEEWREGCVSISLRVEERHLNLYGGMHGGVATAIMDELTGQAIVSVRGVEVMQTTPHTTVEMSVSFIGGVSAGDELVFEGKVIRVGRSVAFAEADVRKRGEEKLVANGKFTYIIMQPRSAA